MRVQLPLKSGFFCEAGRQYIALSEVPRTLNLTTSEITNAVALDQLHIERIRGCKVVALEALMDFIAMRESKK